MAWIIASWRPNTGEGAVRSPHFGPISFGRSENIDQVDDFQPGETVVVEVEGSGDRLLVRSVRPTHQRQPKGTRWPEADRMKSGFIDVTVEESTKTTLQFWIGNCCGHCTPNPGRIRFEDIQIVTGLADEVVLENPLFRFASVEEIGEQHLAVPPGTKAYCIVTQHGGGQDGPRIFIVAGRATVLEPQQAV